MNDLTHKSLGNVQGKEILMAALMSFGPKP